jgi:hypothetical protein
VGLGDEDGEASTRTTFAGEFISTAAKSGPLGKAGGVDFRHLVIGLEGFISGSWRAQTCSGSALCLPARHDNSLAFLQASGRLGAYPE